VDKPFNTGCIEVPESCINCYIFQAKQPVTTDGWSFPLNTYLYGMWLDDYNVEVLNQNYQIEHVDYEIIGELTEKELANVIACFANSSSVKRKYKRWLSS